MTGLCVSFLNENTCYGTIFAIRHASNKHDLICGYIRQHRVSPGYTVVSQVMVLSLMLCIAAVTLVWSPILSERQLCLFTLQSCKTVFSGVRYNTYLTIM